MNLSHPLCRAVMEEARPLREVSKTQDAPMSRLGRIVLALFCLTMVTAAQSAPDHPLRVVLIPADGGTEDGTRADYAPTFEAVTRTTGLQFDIKVAQSYAAVVEAMCNHSADIAFVGPVTYIQAHARG